MKPIIFIAIGIVSLSTILVGCTEDPAINGDTKVNKIEPNTDATGNPSLVAIDGNLFSISSPLESVVLLKNAGAVYKEDIMLEKPDMASLTSNFDKAVHLGMIGADMGYASVHDQQMKSIDQFKTLSALSESLNLSNAVDASLIKRLANNANNQDSLLILVSEFYREADAYLQKEKRMDIAAWILAGGWVESMHLSLDVVKQGNVDLKERLASQKLSYKNLLNLVKSTGDNVQARSMIKDLEKMEDIFEEVLYTYNYQKPTIDIDSKITRLNGTTEYQFTDETLLKLNTSIMELRNKLINN